MTTAVHISYKQQSLEAFLILLIFLRFDLLDFECTNRNHLTELGLNKNKEILPCYPVVLMR